MNTIQSAFDSFRSQVISPEAPAGQIRDMRISFYAGTAALINLLGKIGGTDISEDARVAILEGIKQETLAFAESMRQPTAANN